MEENTKKEEFKVSGEEILAKVKQLIKEGNVEELLSRMSLARL